MNENYNYSQLIGYQVIKGEVLIKRKILKLFRENGFDLTFEQWTVMNVLYAEPGLIQSKIADKTFKDKTNITRILDILGKKGFVERIKINDDRRSYSIYLTSAGRNILEKLIPCVNQTNKQFLENISPGELKIFIKILKKICSNAE